MEKETLNIFSTSVASIVEVVNTILQEAFSKNVSDIHIDPYEETVVIRFRSDGLLYTVGTIPTKTYSEFVARVKILAALKTDEHVLPQDGRFKFNDFVDVRVSIAASYYGESIILRLLHRTQKNFTLEDLGFLPKQRELITHILRAQHGLILVTGPTGSGKTTTLYTLLSMLKDSSVSIVTIEDPIEYAINGVRQIQAKERRGLNFANGLRSILRQDPDIIMVGEIRDKETATLAVNAALTGHLVVSTLHTNDAVSSIIRLLEMDIEPYVIASTLKLIISQRLVRKLCIHCRKESVISHQESELLKKWSMKDAAATFWKNHSCDQCQGVGYKGRTVISEVLQINQIMQSRITKETTITEYKAIAHDSGMTTLIENGIEKCGEGITSVDEIVKVIHE